MSPSARAGTSSSLPATVPQPAGKCCRRDGLRPCRPSSPARQPTFATDEHPDARLSAVHIPFLIFVRLQCQPWIRISRRTLASSSPKPSTRSGATGSRGVTTSKSAVSRGAVRHSARRRLAWVSRLDNLLINACCQCVRPPGGRHHPSGGDKRSVRRDSGRASSGGRLPSRASIWGPRTPHPKTSALRSSRAG
jgi:hypothetical protein